MADTTEVIVGVPADTARSGTDWGAIFGGALLATALSFVLFAFGSGAGTASVSPYSWNNPSVTTLTIIAAAWFVIVMIGSFLAGGYFAGRFARPALDVTADERERRDGGHGLLVWALGLVLGAALAFMTVAATARNVAMVAGGAGAAAAASQPADRYGEYVDTLLRTPPGGTLRGEDPRAEITRIFGNSMSRGQITDADRTYIAQLVAARTGIPEDEARRRVDAAIEQAKAAADRARKAATILAFLIGASSMLAGGAAFWGGMWGGRHRDQARTGAARSWW